MINKLRLLFLAAVLIPQGILFGMAYGSPLETNKYFSQIEAASLASALLVGMIVPTITKQWLFGKQLDSMRKLCSRVKQGNYQELLPLPNESTDEEDIMLALMRDMNWMARRIEIREKDLRQAADDLWKSRNKINEQNKFLISMNSELLAVQKSLQERTIQLETACNHMQVMAMTDPLTSIANRRCFFETLERQFTALSCNCRPISLLIIDIDLFKTINDTYGHQAGDTVLLEMATILQTSIRHRDLVARVGGEEYAILLPDTCSQEAVGIASRVQTAIRAHKFLIGEEQISVTVSIGICTICKFPCCFNIEKLYYYADQALYYSKNSGRDSASIYDPITHSIGKIA